MIMFSKFKQRLINEYVKKIIKRIINHAVEFKKARC